MLLLLAYFTRYLVFEVTSIAALLMGSAFVFTSMESYVKTRPANLSVRAPLMSLHQSLVGAGLTGRVLYVPGKREGEQVKMFVPKPDVGSTKFSEDPFLGDAHGVLLTPPGEGVVKILAEELDGLADKELKYLEEWLPRAVVEGLGLAESMKLEVKDDDIKVEIRRPSFQSLCQDAELNETVCLRFGCPFSSGVAASLAESTGRVVKFVTCGHDSNKETSSGLYRLGAQISERHFEES